MNYREQTGEATSWRRATAIMINNPVDQAPTISFQEEDVVHVGDKTFKTPTMTSVWCSFDPGEEIPLVNPETGEAIGTATHQDFYVLLHSLYLHKAQARDAAELEQAASRRAAAQAAAEQAAVNAEKAATAAKAAATAAAALSGS